MNEVQQGYVTSRDGLSLGYIRVGSGLPLVICHGALSVADHWMEFVSAIASSRTVYVYDRRGRGRSPDKSDPNYEFERELDDLEAMVELAGNEAAVLGHSFGGGCALAYALREGFSGDLILYEPVHSMEQPVSMGQTARLRETIAREGADAGLEFALVNIVRLPPEQVAALRQSPTWSSRAGIIDTFPREVDALDSLNFEGNASGDLVARLTLLLGTLSPQAPYRDSCEQIAHRFPGTKTVALEGQGHVAHLADPAGLAETVQRILSQD